MFSEPSTILKQIDLASPARVADFGTGVGSFAKAAAKIVQPQGKVYAIDVQRELLARLQLDVEHEGISGIETVWGNVEETHGSKLRDGSVDLVILGNVLFQAESRTGILTEAFRVLRSGGSC